MIIKNQNILKSGILLNCLFLFSFTVFAQSKENCKKIKTGTFYFYPAESKQQYMIVRDRFLQKEINLKTNDTSFWKVNWQNDCTFSLKFIKITLPLSEFENSFFHSHNTVIKILAIYQDFYVFKQGLDSLNSKSVTDTLWFKPRLGCLKVKRSSVHMFTGTDK